VAVAGGILPAESGVRVEVEHATTRPPRISPAVPGSTRTWFEIVGVVEDMERSSRGRRAAPRPLAMPTAVGTR